MMTDEELLVYLKEAFEHGELEEEECLQISPSKKAFEHGELTLEGLQISPSQVKTVSDFVNVNNVKELTLHYCSNAVDITREILISNSTLQSLNLTTNQIGDAGASVIANLLKLNSTLDLLNLWDNQIGDVGASSIADSLKVNSTLQILDLMCNEINDVGSSSIADSLKLNSTLQKLDLSGNQIGDVGASSIADSLKLNSTLQKLDLDHNAIGDEGASSIADSLKLNSTLLTFSLYANQIGDVGVKDIGKALESNRIITQVALAEFNNSLWIQRNKELLKKFAKHLIEYDFVHKPLWSNLSYNLSYLNRCNEEIIKKELQKLKVSDPGAVIKKYKDQKFETVQEVMKSLKICGKFQKDQDNHDTWIGNLPAEIIQKILSEAFPGLRYHLVNQLKWKSLELNTNTSQLELVAHDDEPSQIVEILGDADDA